MPLTSATSRDHAKIVEAVVASSAVGRLTYAASWRRSMVHHKLDPAHAFAADRLTEPEIRRRREDYGPFLEVATPVLDRLAKAACDAGCTVLLSDADGLVLDERVREGDRGEFHGSNLQPGTNWSEGSEGTNGIGTCLAEARPVTVWRDQHFRAKHTGLVCMGAPVFGPTGDLAGVIDISSLRSDMTEAYARLVALTVQDAAQRIEADLFRACFNGARILSAARDQTPQGVMLVALDRDDLVIGATRAARRNLGIEDVHLGRLPAGDLFDPESRSTQGLDAVQRSEMTRALARAGGNISAAARDLGIGRATFYRKARTLGVTV